MYFTNTPSLNSMEAIMQRPPGGNQRGGGRIRRAYQFNKADCDCRLCLYHRKKKGCSMEICPVLDARLTCGAASFYYHGDESGSVRHGAALFLFGRAGKGYRY